MSVNDITKMFDQLGDAESKKSDRIKKLEEQKKQLAAKLAAEKNAEAKQKRKDDTRRKIILGAIFMNWIRDGVLSEDQRAKFQAEIMLMSARDKALFGIKDDKKDAK